MTLVPTVLAPALVLVVAIGGLLIFHVTERRANRAPTGPRQKAGAKSFAKPPARARRKMP